MTRARLEGGVVGGSESQLGCLLQWLEEHQFLESLIQIICGTYMAEAPTPPREPPGAAPASPARPCSPIPPPSPSPPEKGQREHSEKLNCNHTHDDAAAPQGDDGTPSTSLANCYCNIIILKQTPLH